MSLLQYSPIIQGLTSIFFQHRNDIDIYTEDKISDKEFYSTLFSRLLTDTNIVINDVTPLGCRKNVLEKRDTDFKNKIKRKRIYVVDSDIFLVYGNDKVNHDDVHSLGYYCIENAILDSKGIIEIMHSEVASKSRPELTIALDYDNWLSSLSPLLSDMFLHYALHESVFGYFELKDASHVCSDGKNQPRKLDSNKVNLIIEKHKQDIIASIGETEYLLRIDELRIKWPYDAETLKRIVSGKDYLLPLTQYRIHEIKGKKTSMSLETFKMHLAKNTSLENLTDLKNKIIQRAA